MRSVTKLLILVLAMLAAVVAVLLIMDIPAWPVIVAYWITLTAKNLIDYIAGGGRHGE